MAGVPLAKKTLRAQAQIPLTLMVFGPSSPIVWVLGPLGCRGAGLLLRVYGLGFKVRVWGLGFRV